MPGARRTGPDGAGTGNVELNKERRTNSRTPRQPQAGSGP